jgi:hypothetical protein
MEEFKCICNVILKENFIEGYYRLIFKDEFDYLESIKPSISIKECKDLKPQELKNSVLEKWENYLIYYKVTCLLIDEYNFILEALKSENAIMAYAVLENRRFCEYEEFKIIYVKTNLQEKIKTLSVENFCLDPIEKPSEFEDL